MTSKEALNVQHRSVSSRDAEVLLCHVLGVDRALLHSHPERELTEGECERYEAALVRREQNEPVAYITGVKEFFGRPFKADRRALIPRPETEGVIEQALHFLPDRFWSESRAHNKPCPLHILELGTGCGCIAVTLAAELATRNIPATLIATDVSSEAVELAKENAQALIPANQHISLKLLTASLFDDPAIKAAAPYDLITANLPYVESTWAMNPAAQPDVVFYEPDVALFGGEDGLDLYRQFFAEAPAYLAEGGQVIIEYGETQTPALLPIAQAAFPTKKASVYRDYAGLDRVLVLS